MVFARVIPSRESMIDTGVGPVLPCTTQYLPLGGRIWSGRLDWKRLATVIMLSPGHP